MLLGERSLYSDKSDVNNLSLFAGVSYRNFDINANTNGFSGGNNFWIRAGIRADLFNWYFDF